MSKESSPTASEGYGFNYADKVGALCLLALLRRAPIGGSDLGVITRVQFGQRPAGWHFDDVLLTLDKDGSVQHLALSIKSASHVNANGIAREVVDLAWQQLEDGAPFQEDADTLALAQPSVAPAIQTALAELSRWSLLQEDGQTEAWVRMPGVGNDLKRSLIASVQTGEGREDAQRFFRSLRVLFFDVDPPQDQSITSALEGSTSVLRNPTDAHTKQLWEKLEQLAKQYRANAGTLTLNDLVRELTPAFLLREHPRVEPDIKRLVAYSRDRHLSSVKTTIGDTLVVPTDGAQAELASALTANPIVFFLGPSGIGKSVVLRNYAEQAPEGELRLYWRADLDSLSPTALVGTVRLDHDIGTILSEGRHATVTLIVDQVDRLVTDAQLADITELLVLVQSLSQVRLIFGSQSAEGEAIISRLRVHLPAGQVDKVFFNPDEEAIFQVVINSYPPLKNIAFRKELRAFLTRPKNLDLLVERLDNLGVLTAGEVTSQKQFIDWFWGEYIDDGDDGLARATTVSEIANLQADELSSRLSPGRLTDRAALGALRKAKIITGDDKGIAFQHDLYGDWARFRLIESNAAVLVSYLRDRGTNPIWLRAIRLWSAIVLETDGSAKWKSIFDSFSESNGAEWMVRDAMLDGLSLAAGSYDYLTELADVLFEDNGRLLRRFLARFLFASTWPDVKFAEAVAGGDSSILASFKAKLRIPQWYLWWPVIHFIVRNPECGKLAPELIIEVLVKWLEHIEPGTQTAAEASAIALTITREYMDSDVYRSRDNKDHTTQLFRCAFFALRHVPKQAQEVLRKAAGLIGEDRYGQAELINGQRYVKSVSFLSPGKSRVVGPWPEGPIVPPNEVFRNFVLTGGGLADSLTFSPSFAREVIMACLIDPPREEEPRHGLSDFFPERSLRIANDRQVFSPPLYNKNLFHFMFAMNPTFAMDIVLAIVDFASERWDEARAARSPQAGFSTEVGGKVRPLLGDGASYTWHRDGGRSSDTLVCALMSLEKHVYDQVEANLGEVVVESLVARMRSTAILGLLVTIGRRYPALFNEKLRFAHFNEIVQWWDMELVGRGESHQMIGWQFQPASQQKAAEKWNSMPQRRTPLKFLAFYALQTPEGRAEAKKACARWKRLAKKASGEVRRSLENLAATYNIKNYKFTKKDDGFLIQCVLPAAMQKENVKLLAESEASMRPLILALRCRQLLDGEKTLPDEEREPLFQEAQKVRQEEVVGAPHVHAEDPWCGVAAVFLVQHREWLQTQPEIEAWCFKVLIATCLNPPAPTLYEVEESVSTDLWCHFAAQSMPIIWAERPDDSRIRVCMACLIEDLSYKTIGYLAPSLFTLRSAHPGFYYQSLNLIRAWSVELIRQRELAWAEQRAPFVAMDLADDDESAPQIGPNDYPGIRAKFLEGTLATAVEAWPAAILPPRRDRGRGGINERRRRAQPQIETVRLGYFVANLPNIESVEGADRSEVIDRWLELFEEIVLELRGDEEDQGRSVDSYSNEPEMFRLFGTLAASLEDCETLSKFLDGIRGIASFASYQVEQFFYGFFMRLLAGSPIGLQAEANWLLALEVFLGSKRPEITSWVTDSFGRASVADGLVGNLDLLLSYEWRDEHQPFVKQHTDIYGSWVKAMCSNTRSLAKCLRFLMAPPAQPIVAEACLWIHGSFAESLLDQYGANLNDELALFLEYARPTVASVRSERPDIFSAYLALLAILNKRDNRLAMQLLDDVATMP